MLDADTTHALVVSHQSHKLLPLRCPLDGIADLQLRRLSPHVIQHRPVLSTDRNAPLRAVLAHRPDKRRGEFLIFLTAIRTLDVNQHTFGACQRF